MKPSAKAKRPGWNHPTRTSSRTDLSRQHPHRQTTRIPPLPARETPDHRTRTRPGNTMTTAAEAYMNSSSDDEDFDEAYADLQTELRRLHRLRLKRLT